MDLARAGDPVGSNFLHKRKEGPWCADHENRIILVEEKTTRIDQRQERIYVSMYGPNGDPREGWVWKIEQVLLWFYGDPKKGVHGFLGEWASIKRVALGGAWSAVVLLIGLIASALGYFLWQLFTHLIKSGWTPG